MFESVVIKLPLRAKLDKREKKLIDEINNFFGNYQRISYLLDKYPLDVDFEDFSKRSLLYEIRSVKIRIDIEDSKPEKSYICDFYENNSRIRIYQLEQDLSASLYLKKDERG